MFNGFKYFFLLVISVFTFGFSDSQEPAIGLNLGNRAPDIELRNPEQKVMTLSSLRGKMVLVDFWASWCGPCRAENPNVVKSYLSYKDRNFKQGKGFEVYSVSLDTQRDRWSNAIADDGLIWKHHVSDLQGWTSGAAFRYQVTSIPANFLINENGIIVNKNLFGENLNKALNKLLAQ